MKRFLATFLTVAMIATSFPAVAFAEEENANDQTSVIGGVSNLAIGENQEKHVSTEEQLISAIANAQGTEENPTVIIVDNSIKLSKNIFWGGGKYITLRGADESITIQLSADATLTESVRQFAMFDIGSLDADVKTKVTFENIILDANSIARILYVYGENTTVTMNENTIIQHGGGGVQGAGICIADNSTFVMNGGEISENIAGTDTSNNSGGAVAMYTDANFYMNGGSIKDNYARRYGGGFYSWGGVGLLSISGGKITGNSGGYGGAITVLDCPGNRIRITGGTIKDNTNRSTNNAFSDNIFIQNVSVDIGGDVRIAEGGTGNDGIYVNNNNQAEVNINVVKALSEGAAVGIKDGKLLNKISGTDDYTVTDKDASKFFMTSKNDVVFYADKENNQIKWATAKTVIFDANGGEGTMDAQKVPKNIETALSANKFTNKGKKFMGWSTTADGVVVYNDGDNVAFSADTTLYAKWEICTDHNFNNGVCTLCGHNQSVLSTDIGEKTFTVGVPVEFTFTTEANDDVGVMVVGTSNFSNTEAIEKLEYYEINDSTWHEFSGDFGSSAGFPMSDATSKFRVTFSKDGEYSFTASMNPVGGGDALCSTAVSFSVSKNELELKADKTEMRGKGNVTLTLSGLLGDDSATVTCDDSSISVTKNSDGTYSAYLPNRTQTYTFTATAANTDKYATDDVVVSVRKKSSSSSSDSSSGTSTVKPEEKPEEKPAEPDVKPEEKPDEKPTTPTSPAEIPAAEKIVLTVGQRVANAFGSPVVNDVAPIIRNDRTMLPIRFVAEALGAAVTWDGTLQKVTITKGDDVIDIYIGSVVAFVNGNPVDLDSPAFIENGRTYLPLRFVAENLGATVFWNAETQEVTIVPNK